MTSYAQIENIGRNFNTKMGLEDSENPLTSILYDGVGVLFMQGPNAYDYSAFTTVGQNYIKLYAAGYYSKENVWDQVCLYFYYKYNQKYTAPLMTINLAADNRAGADFTNEVNSGLTLGQMLLRNAAECRFLKIHGVGHTAIPVKPTVPNSPEVLIQGFNCSELSGIDSVNCINEEICQRGRPLSISVILDKNSIDNDKLMNFIIEEGYMRYIEALDVMCTIYLAYIHKTLDIAGTKLETFFKKNSKYLDMMSSKLIYVSTN